MTMKLRQFIPEPLREIGRHTRAALLSWGLQRRGEFVQPAEEVEASRRMSVVVAISDTPGVTQRCLKSLAKYAPGAEIILVNDGSGSQTVEIIQQFQREHGWKVVHHTERHGHSRCCESGARLATQPYLCLLNSDTVVTPRSWRAAEEAFEADPRIGVTGPSTSYCSTPQMIPRAMHCRHYWTDAQIWAFAEQYVTNEQPRSWSDLTVASGFAFFIRRSLWIQLGGFDPKLPDYGNETELCRRIANCGYRIVWTKNSYIHHLGRQSYGRMGDSTVDSRSRAARKYIEAMHGHQPLGRT